MLNLAEIEKEIKNLENSDSTSYNVCQKLAILYIVKDHLQAQSSSLPMPAPSLSKTGI